MDSPNVAGAPEAPDPPKTCYVLVYREVCGDDQLLGAYDSQLDALSAMFAYIERRGARGRSREPGPENPEPRRGRPTIQIVSVPVNALPEDW